MSLADIADDKMPLGESPPFAGGGWNSTETPEDGAPVEVFAIDWRGPYLISFPVFFRDDDWFNANMGHPLASDVYIAGWRPWKERA